METIVIDETYTDSDLINHKGQRYPKIVIDEKLIAKPSIVPKHLTDVFLDNDKNFIRRLFHHFQSKGFVSSLILIQNSYDNTKIDGIVENRVHEKNSFCFKLLYFIATFILFMRYLYLKIHYYFYPFDELTDEELLKEFNENPEWNSNVIRAFSWHENSLRCAVALINDSIYVYTADDRRPINHIYCFKNIQQRDISTICWHPKDENFLAVACHHKVLFWSLKSNSNDNQSSTNNLQQTQQLPQIVETNLSTITSIVFNAEGDRLVACSPRNSSLCLIHLDPKSIRYQVIRKYFFPQLIKLNWSPDKTRIFAHATYPKLCIFESIQWSYKFWRMPECSISTICQTSAWSRPSGRILLFVPKNSSKVYALTFFDRAEANDVGGGPSNKSIMVLDASQHVSDGKNIGGIIHQICWNSKSTNLAISFKDLQDTIAVYDTQLNPGLRIKPLFLIKSGFHTTPRCLLISFHNSYIDSGSLLTICWSNGHLTHLPISNNPMQEQSLVNENLQETSIRSLTSLCSSFDESLLSIDLRNSTPTTARTPIKHLTNGLNGKSQSKIAQSPLSSPLSLTPRRGILYSTRLKSD
ncbi:Aladin [Sarcoptes scabiei]|uniref:Aladin n=1 Tax=Sarcoptes scabiei TaxID=52283 RepID=A0A131ZXY8_SARSC|nr:Aladin [Sarcoptes scabiei]KPM02970.1 hypothetical protein QR98_0013970 [Sarcoptes scabiei]